MPPQLPYERLIRFHMVWETVENTTRIPLAHVVGNLNSDSLSGLTTFSVCSSSRPRRSHGDMDTRASGSQVMQAHLIGDM
ncbi:hypothetical protein TNCV_4860781 [Trichonephila clavipes]|nr:hypothetical protein TNCV_4860781 [Trichonephila clavipes]